MRRREPQDVVEDILIDQLDRHYDDLEDFVPETADRIVGALREWGFIKENV